MSNGIDHDECRERIKRISKRLRSAHKDGKLTEEQITRLEAIGFKWDWGFNAPFSETHPELAKQWHPTKNGDLTPQDVTAGSGKKAWWKCPDCGGEWEARVCMRRSQRTGCPFCINKKVLPGFNDLATTHPELAKQWHPTKNGELTPRDVVAGSEKKVWWKCEKGHEWETMIVHRASGRQCPKCAIEKRRTGRSKPVVCIEMGKLFKSATEAAERFGKNQSTMIRSCLKGRNDTAYGYHWRYATEEEIAAHKQKENIAGGEPNEEVF